MPAINSIDTHSHIHFPDYDGDRTEVLSRARLAGIGMIAVGTDIKSSEAAIRLAEAQSDIVVGATAGFHPTYPIEEYDFIKLRVLAKNSRVIGIGECGLDYYRITDQDQQKKQHEIFADQIGLSSELQKPLIIHCRQAFPDLISILGSKKDLLLTDRAGVLHFFSGTWEEAQKLLNLGFYLGFGGVITFARNYDEVIQKAPIERVLVETDAPYVSPMPYRGKRNESCYITEVIKTIAELRREKQSILELKLLENTERLFRIL